jgi:hypothetical protein
VADEAFTAVQWMRGIGCAQPVTLHAIAMGERGELQYIVFAKQEYGAAVTESFSGALSHAT